MQINGTSSEEAILQHRITFLFSVPRLCYENLGLPSKRPPDKKVGILLISRKSNGKRKRFLKNLDNSISGKRRHESRPL